VFSKVLLFDILGNGIGVKEVEWGCHIYPRRDVLSSWKVQIHSFCPQVYRCSI